MLKPGTREVLRITKKVKFGVYLGREGEEQTVLLPAKEVDEGAGIGDEIEVFLYKDSADRLIATRRETPLTLYHTAVLQVKEVSRIGAFLDWGLEKDLLLPFHEQTKKVRAGEEVLAALYLDKSQRLCATMKVYHYLNKHSPYAIGDEVEGRVYEISGNFGVFVAVDDKYSALIPKKEAAGTFNVGEIIHARVTDVKEDGKLDLSVRKKAYLQIDEDAEAVEQVLREYAGVLPFGEKASSETIRREFGLTKNAFKRALGRLYKNGKVRIEDDHIYLLE